MKRFYTLLAALLIALTCSTSASAGTMVGNEDNSTPFWGAHSDDYIVESGKAYHFVFKNWGIMQNNWNNWHLVAKDLNSSIEYFVERSDCWFWGADLNPGSDPYVSVSDDFNWTGTTFVTEMNGATVDMIVKYEKGKYISVNSTITSLSQNTYHYSFKYSKAEMLTDDAISVDLTVDNSHLEILTAEEYVEEDPSPYEVIGNKDFTTGYLGDRSTPVTLAPGQTYQYTFINHNNINNPGLMNWNNWILVASQGGADKVILRADNYELVAGSNAGCISGYNWNTFSSDYNGAEVTLTVKYSEGNILSTTAKIKKADGTYLPDYTYNSTAGNITGLSGDLTIALSVENAWVEIIEEKFIEEEVIDGPKTVGATDFSTPYLGARSESMILSPGKSYQYTFINHNNINDPNLMFFHNWIFVASQGGADKVVLRADNYELVAGSNAGCSSGYNWETFSSDYNGAEVTLTVTYTEDNILKTRAQIKKADGTSLPDYTYDSAAGNITGLSGDLVIALSVEKAWLEILDEKFVEIEQPEEVEGAVGSTDCSTPYLGASSDPQTLSAGTAYLYNFINHNDINNAFANNWIVTVSQNGAPIAVVRADNWEVVNASNSGFDSAINWETFMSDLHDAEVTITVNYSNNNILTITALTKKATAAAKGMMAASEDDGYLPVYTWSSEKAGLTISGDIDVALSVDKSWVEILDEHECEATAIRNIASSDNIAAKKSVRQGKLVIETANGTYNAVGAMLK